MFWKLLRNKTQNQKHPACCVRRKSYSENLWEIPRKSYLTVDILKAYSYIEYELCHSCYLRNFWNIFRKAILIKYLSMNVPYFIEEHLWMSASDEATLKFPYWERQTFPQNNFLSQKYFLIPVDLFQGSHVQNHWVAPRSTQSFILPRLIKWVSIISGNLLVKTKLSPQKHTGSSLEVVEPNP